MQANDAVLGCVVFGPAIVDKTTGGCEMTSDWSRGGAQKEGWLGDGEGGAGVMQVCSQPKSRKLVECLLLCRNSPKNRGFTERQ